MTTDPPSSFARPKLSRASLLRMWVFFIGLATLVQLLFKKSGEALEHIDSVAGFAAVALSSPWVWASIICYVVVFLFWIRILQRMDLAQAFPMTGLTYMTVPLSATVLFGEHIYPVHAIGIALILAGVFVLGSET